MNRTTLLILLPVLAVACSSSRPRLLGDGTSGGEGNRIVQIGDPIDGSTGNEDKVIFKGGNNEVYLEYLNSFFHDEGSKDVLIIEGNGNRFRLSHNHVIDNSIGSCDTLVIRGDGNHIDLLRSYFIDNSNGRTTATTLLADSLYEVIDMSSAAVLSIMDSTENKLTHQWLPIRKVFDQYQKGAIAGDILSTFYLAEMHQFGVGVLMDPVKAAYYYNMSAAKGHRDSQAALGYLYENDYTGVAQNIELAKYWYQKAADQGDADAIERLRVLSR